MIHWNPIWWTHWYVLRTTSNMNQFKSFWQWLSRLFVITLRKSHLIILIVILQCWQNFVIYWCCNVRFSAHSRNMPFTLQLASTKSLLQFHYTCPQEIPRRFMKMKNQNMILRIHNSALPSSLQFKWLPAFLAK